MASGFTGLYPPETKQARLRRPHDTTQESRESTRRPARGSAARSASAAQSAAGVTTHANRVRQ